MYVFEDVEYLTENTNIIYDGTVGSGDLPSNPPILPDEPKPFIRDSIVQPNAEKGKLIITWITNFTSDCILTLDGVSYKVSGAVVVPGYYTYHAVVSASLNAAHTYSISGKGTSVTKSFRYNDSSRYLICGDPQIIDQSSADVWYKVQKILDPLPAMIISMGDQVDKENAALVMEEQKLREEKEKLVNFVGGDKTRIKELQKLMAFTSKGMMLTAFEDETFLAFVESITVESRTKIVFHLKCGLNLTERLVN